jgi:hypothetical protein
MTTSPRIIQLWTSDRVIHNIQSVLIDLCDAMSKQQDILLSNFGEGPCLASLTYKQDTDLLTLLKECCKRFNYDPKKLTYETGNQIEDKTLWPNIIINYDAGTHFLFLQNKIKNFDKHFKYHFGSFIQYSTYPRLYFGSLLHHRYKDKSLYSFRRDLSNPADTMHMDVEQFLFNFLDRSYMEQLFALLKDIPIQPLQSDPRKIDSADILESYNSFLVDIVTETYFSGRTFFLSEKTARPLVTKTPFLMFGAKNTLKNLKQIGFQTFDKFWSESYDGAEGALRCQMISAVIEKISKMPVDQLKNLYNRMLPILEHNYKIYHQLKESDLKDGSLLGF